MPANIDNLNLLISRARQLQTAIRAEAPLDEIEQAVRQLEKVARERGDFGVAAIERFEPDANRKQTDPSSEDALASIAFELHAGNLLIATAQAIPDEAARKPAEPKLLDEALQTLENARNTVEQETSSTRRAHFEAEIGNIAPTIDLKNAPAEFRQRAEAVLKGIVTHGGEVVQKVFGCLNHLDPSKILEGLSKFAELSDSLSSAGRLLKIGIEKIQAAYNALVRLIGQDALKKIKDKVEKIWVDFKNGNYTRDGLRFIYRVENIGTNVDVLLASPKLDPNRLIQGCAEIAPLEPKFKTHMALLSGIVSGITVAAAVLAFTPINTQVAPFIAASYLAVLGAVLVIGIAYAGSPVLYWVRGVGVIVADLAAASANAQLVSHAARPPSTD